MSKQRFGCQCLGSLTCTHMLMHAIAHEGCTDMARECALKVDSGRKIPCRTGESNLRQRRAGPPLHQLSYIPILLCLNVCVRVYVGVWKTGSGGGGRGAFDSYGELVEVGNYFLRNAKTFRSEFPCKEEKRAFLRCSQPTRPTAVRQHPITPTSDII